MRKTLSKMVLEQKPKAKRIEVRDTESPLVFRLTDKGDRKLCVRTRIGKEQVRLTYPGAAIVENLTEARLWAHRTVEQCQDGKDPRETKEASEKALQRANESAERRKFSAIVATYLERRVRKEKGNRTADAIEWAFNTYFLPRWRDLSVMDIKRQDVNDVLDTIFDGKVELNGKLYGGPVAADKALAQLRACFRWYATKDEAFVSPVVSGMARTNAGKLARVRVLSDDEIRALWTVTAEPGTFNAIVRSLLLTAQRRDEVACMARSEIVGDTWTIPSERYKTGKANAVPLTAKVLALVEAQDQIGKCDFVFTTNGKTPFCGFGKGKARLDKEMLEALGRETFEKGNWTLHDLRRSARTLMSRAGVRPDISERVLGHVIAGVEGTYDRHDYMGESKGTEEPHNHNKRAALEALAAQIDRIVNPPADNVVLLREATQ